MSLFYLGKDLDQRLIQLSQIQDKSKEILLILEEIQQKEGEWTQEQREEALNQGRKTLDNMESLMTTVIGTNYKLEELDKNLVNSLTSKLLELEEQLLYQIKEENAELKESVNELQKKAKGNRGLLCFLMILQFIGFGALAFIILYLLDLIYF